MITYVLGDLFTSPADVLVNTVNTVGVMGKGIAKDFKKHFPEMFKEYERACTRGLFTIGTLHFYPGPHKSVLNFPTKRHWKSKAELDDIEIGLKTFVEKYDDFSILSIAFPQLGCGNGELDWENQVRPVMEAHLSPLPISVYIHLYDASAAFTPSNDVTNLSSWLRSEPRRYAFVDFLHDLEVSVRQRSSKADDWGWTIGIEKFPGSVRLSFAREDNQVVLENEQLRGLWQQLNSFGFISNVDLPKSASSASKSIIGTLASLEYLKRARFCFDKDLVKQTTRLENSNAWNDGLKFVPQESLSEFAEQSALLT